MKDQLEAAIREKLEAGVRPQDIRIHYGGCVWRWSPLGFWDMEE